MSPDAWRAPSRERRRRGLETGLVPAPRLVCHTSVAVYQLPATVRAPVAPQVRAGWETSMTVATTSRRRVLSQAAATASMAIGAPACARGLRSASDGKTALRLRRGVNFHHLLNWPQLASQPGQPLTYLTPPFSDGEHAFDPGEARRVRAAGFDFVRLTLDPAIHLAASPGERRALEMVVLDRVRGLNAADLAVIVDLHPVSQNPRYAPERLVVEGAPDFPAYGALVGRLAKLLAAESRRVALELFNEPPGYQPEVMRRWQGQLEMLHATARASAPKLTLVINGARWDAPEPLQQLNIEPFRSGPVIYTFHYYAPYAFTHQGVEMDVVRYMRDLEWPGQPGQSQAVLGATLTRLAADPAVPADRKEVLATELRRVLSEYPGEATVIRLESDFAALAAWASRNGLPPSNLLMGEFGAVKVVGASPAQRRSRLAWLAAVRRTAERHAFPWAFWALKGYGGMELIPKGSQVMDTDTLQALGLSPVAVDVREGAGA